MIAERYTYLDQVFKDVKTLTRNLKVMKFNTDHDWYNCSIISQFQSRNENEVRVYSIKRWQEIFQENLNIIVPLSGQRVFLLEPIFDEEDCLLNFKPKEFYYSSYLSNNQKKVYRCKSQAQAAMEEYSLKKNASLLKKGWQEQLLDDYLNKYSFYVEADEQMKEFYRNIMLYTFGSNLLIETRRIKLKIPESKDNLSVYRNIHQLITNFHIAFKTFLSLLDENHRELKDKGVIEDRPFRKGYERLKSLERGIR